MMAELLIEPNMLEQIQALELLCEELYLESKELFGNQNHLLLILFGNNNIWTKLHDIVRDNSIS